MSILHFSRKCRASILGKLLLRNFRTFLIIFRIGPDCLDLKGICPHSFRDHVGHDMGVALFNIANIVVFSRVTAGDKM